MTMAVRPEEAKALARQGYLPVMEVVRRTMRTKPTIYNWIESGQIKGVRIGAHWYVLWQSVLDYYRDQDPEALKLLGLK